jgi:hypothetical protein
MSMNASRLLDLIVQVSIVAGSDEKSVMLYGGQSLEATIGNNPGQGGTPFIDKPVCLLS